MTCYCANITAELNIPDLNEIELIEDVSKAREMLKDTFMAER